jgi:hypothetical protein
MGSQTASCGRIGLKRAGITFGALPGVRCLRLSRSSHLLALSRAGDTGAAGPHGGTRTFQNGDDENKTGIA